MNKEKVMKNIENYFNLVEFFNVSLKTVGVSKSEIERINTIAVKYGYIVHPDACNAMTEKFLKGLDCDFNSTFYKTWDDVTSKSRFELFLDQVLHYATTYGTGFAMGNGYVPNDRTEEVIADYSTYKMIMPVTCEEMYDRCFAMIKSGIALKQSTMDPVCNYVIDYSKVFGVNVDLDSVTNKEALVYLCRNLGVRPRNEFNLIRYILYVTTGKSLVVSNKATIDEIKSSVHCFDFSTLTHSEIEALSKIFYRYKDLILAFKHNSYIRKKGSNHVINMIRRRAVVNHKPLKVGLFERILNSSSYGNVNLVEVENKAEELTNFKIITLMQAIKEKFLDFEMNHKMYIIRNGKVFFGINKKYKKRDEAESAYYEYLYNVFNILNDRLVANLRKKACKVKFNNSIELACPTSEKNFIGNIPFGSYVDFTQNNYVGIYWRDEWGTSDFDLSFNDVNGGRIGWDSSYYNKDGHVVYSGDMTSADPEAAELLLMKKGCENGTVYVNRFSGWTNQTKFKFMFGQEEISTNKMFNRMVNPGSIKVQTMIETEKRQVQVGMVNDNRLFLCDFKTGNNRLANSVISEKSLYDYMTVKSKTFIPLKAVLLDAGFVEYVNDEVSGEFGENDIDFNDLNKDTLISLFS